MSPYSKAVGLFRRCWAGRGGLVALSVLFLGCTSLAGVEDDYGNESDSGFSGSDAGSTGGDGGSAGSRSGSGGTGGSTSGGSGGRAGGEDCLNGVDDDGDELSDCADPDCGAQGFQCVSAPPSGWSGPHALWVGSPPHAPCPANYPDKSFTGWEGLNAPAPSCSCSCSSPSNIRCEALVGFWDYKATSYCDATPTGLWYSKTSGCSPKTSLGWYKLYDYRAGGTCATGPVKKSIPPAAWKTGKQLCQPKTWGGGCENSALCAPPVATPYAAKLCVAKEGEHTCPSPYLAKHSMHLGKNDTRDCDCDCEVKAGACKGFVSLDASTSCGINAGALSLGVCKKVTTGPITVKLYNSSVASKPTCSPKETIKGSAEPAQPLTVCCLQ